jgi:hypothetical protein
MPATSFGVNDSTTRIVWRFSREKYHAAVRHLLLQAIFVPQPLDLRAILNRGVDRLHWSVVVGA